MPHLILEPCTCEDCLGQDDCCFGDCDEENPCAGCRQARLNDKELQHEIEVAMGRS